MEHNHIELFFCRYQLLDQEPEVQVLDLVVMF